MERRCPALNNIGYAVLIVFLSLCQGAWAKDPYVDINATMCEEGETVYISCAFDGDVDQYSYVGPVASVCAKLNTSPNGGYVQYRYGIPSYDSSKGRLELQYPEKKHVPSGLFKIYRSDNSESFGTALRFTNGDYMYSFEKFDLSGYRVVVRKQGVEVFNKSCTLPGKDYLVDKAFQGIDFINLGQGKIPKSRE
jgi:hypothetical protein